MEAVCAASAYAPMLEAPGCHVVGTDELTGIQALERAAPTKPARPGGPARREREHIRHGTLSLIATFSVATGEILAPSPGPTRTEADFAGHSARTVDTDPAAAWLFLTDQLNTHQSETPVRRVAGRRGLTDDRGVKGPAGILRSRASRAAFLGDPAHRISFLHIPKHTSWLHQIELRFGILVRRARRRGNFASLDALRARIPAFIAYCNQTAHPFRWTYRGHPLCR